MQAAGEVKRVPLREIAAKSVKAHHAVLDESTVHRDVGIEVAACTKGVLDFGDGVGTKGADSGVVIAMLLEVDGVPVLGVRNTEDEIDHFGVSFLHFCNSLRR